MIFETICDNCDATVMIAPTRWAQQFPSLWDRLEGVCIKCGKEVKRRLYKCRDCDRNTVHKYIRTDKEKQTGIFQCEVCHCQKSIYWGLRKSPERSMMPTGR